MELEKTEIAAERTRQSWPTPQEYNEALQNLATCFADPELQAGVTSVDALGLPRAVSGAFASVYQVRSGAKTFAVRCFLNNTRDVEQRYDEISKYIMGDDLPYTVSFEYQRRGVLIRGEWFPILKMDWVEGKTLERFVEEHLNNPLELKALHERFQKMCWHLQRAGIAHGDLQHGNILVTESRDLRLVDYDGMYVPALQGWKSNELGHRNYQHPKRDATHFGPYLDTFAKWSINVSLLALTENPAFYASCNSGIDCLLLRRSDYEDPELSQAVRCLVDKGSTDLVLALKSLLWYAQNDPPAGTEPAREIAGEELQPFDQVSRLLPKHEDAVALWWTAFLQKQSNTAGSLASEKILFKHPFRKVRTKETRSLVYVRMQPKEPMAVLKENLWISAAIGILFCGAGIFACLAVFAACFLCLIGRISEPNPFDADSPELISRGAPAKGTITDSKWNSHTGTWTIVYEYRVPLEHGRFFRRAAKYSVPPDRWDNPKIGTDLTILYFEDDAWTSIPYRYSPYVASLS